MKELLLANVHDYNKLEELYQSDKEAFESAFNELQPQIENSPAAYFWNARLRYKTADPVRSQPFDYTELGMVVLLSVVAAFISKIPTFASGVNGDLFYQRNFAFIVLPALSVYYLMRQKIQLGRVLVIGVLFLIAAVFINLLPNNRSDAIVLSCIHLPLFLLTLFGLSYMGAELRSFEKRMKYLRVLGEVAILSGLILIAGIFLTVLSLMMFRAIDVDAGKFYEKWVAIIGLAVTPIVAAFIRECYPGIVNKVTPMIARIFTPLLIVTLAAYLIAMAVNGSTPYSNREVLVVFNLLLAGVMAVIIFSIAETPKDGGRDLNTILLSILAGVTLIVNGIALSAILYRTISFGITPNRAAVLGSNILMFANIAFVFYLLIRHNTKQGSIRAVEESVAKFLPYYAFWTAIVCFSFPFIFGFERQSW